MEIRVFAERVLFGDRLDDKLLDVGSGAALTDEAPGSRLGTVALPGRPPSLALGRPRSKVAFPALSTLDRPRERGRVLHFFANHELLAMELMALALLRFPDAPAAFRRGVVGTLLDEQRHMRLYLERMSQAGVSLGEIPVSQYFWDVIATMQTPLDFVARLSLTFEQANLDYAAHYADAFATIGDQETADVLQRVFEDEIRHVEHGARWFEVWRDPSQSAFDAYKALLPAPLTPSRAKGRQRFCVDARRRAGLGERYIERMRVFGGSRGRPPDVYWFNPTCEAELARGANYAAKAHIAELAVDLETLPWLLAGDDDVVVVTRAPSAAFAARLQTAGFASPELRVTPRNAPVTLDSAHVRALKPWGWSAVAAQKLSALVDRTTDPGHRAWSPSGGPARKEWSAKLLQRLGDEAGWPEWWCPPEAVGVAVVSMEEAVARCETLHALGYANAVVKAPLGTSGRGAVRALGGALDDRARGWIARTLQTQGAVVVEPWLDKVIDLSLQLSVPRSGAFRTMGLTRFATDSRGQYLGTLLGKATHGLPKALLRWLTGDGRDPGRVPRAIETIGATVCEALQSVGYAGPVGVDMLIYRTADSAMPFRIKPIVELNPRQTMGQLALAMRHRCAPRTIGLWSIVPVRAVIQAGYASAAAFGAHAQQRHPLTSGEAGDGWRRGVLFTTDPAVATQAVSLAVISDSLADCQAIYDELGLAWPLAQ